MKKYLLILCMLAAAIGFSACENDDFDDNWLVGSRWVGDLGVFTRSGIPLESGIAFDSDGFGDDKLYFYREDGGTYYDTFRISWSLNYETIQINYGNNAPPREIRNIYVRGNELTGDLYIFDDHPDPFYGRITLYRQ